MLFPYVLGKPSRQDYKLPSAKIVGAAGTFTFKKWATQGPGITDDKFLLLESYFH